MTKEMRKGTERDSWVHQSKAAAVSSSRLLSQPRTVLITTPSRLRSNSVKDEFVRPGK